MTRRKILWAPWRLRYVQRTREEGCVFCKVRDEAQDPENLILFRGDATFAILNRFPYNTGHLMVIPNRHVSDPEELSPDEAREVWSLLVRAKRALGAVFRPHGYNVGLNIGVAAGAGIADHLHLHVVPRWTGDTNFMPVLGSTDIISQDLRATYEALRPSFVALEP
ncbi:MAG: HIT domain-containing protein [Deltaproteobacteria bacterium]|nr:HIT domain-containing protein [Deltaproteobacteria bacterium]